MRKIRIAIVCFFIFSSIFYGVYTSVVWLKSDGNTPEISFEEDVIYVSAKATEEELLAGVTATDVESGDLTDRVQIASMSPLLQEAQRTIQYIVFDDAEKLGSATRTVVYTDYVSPRIYLKEPLRFTLSNYMTALEKLQVEATDLIDGDITNKVKTTWADLWYTDSTGVYPFTFQVNNSAGDTCILEVEVILSDDNAEKEKCYPMLKDYVVYTKVGETLSYGEYLWGVQMNGVSYEFGSEDMPLGISRNKVTVHPMVDYTQSGTYKVEYSYTTTDEVKAVTTLYVVVEE